ncbi:Hypothetical protein A7982_07181 [Minicystis rosea]|nr:Hypothetical protein A7982_07181 [Minicystis rosea]
MVASVARADVPNATWSGLQGRDVIVETESGKTIGGKLIDVQSATVALVLADGSSMMIDRSSVHSARLAEKNEELSARFPAPAREPPKEVAPGVFEWREGDDIPPGYYKSIQKRPALIISGSVVFGTAWLGSAIAGAAVGTPILAIPVAGPFIEGARLWKGGDVNGLFAFFLVMDGIQQTVGLGVLIGGLAANRTVVRSDVKRPKAWWLPTPMSFGPGSVGLGIVGAM